MLSNLGLAYVDSGNARKAITFLELGLVIAREIGDQRGEATVCWHLGRVLAQQGELARAVILMKVFVDFQRALGHPKRKKLQINSPNSSNAQIVGGVGGAA